MDFENLSIAKISAAAVLPAAIFFFRLALDTFNMHDVENVFLTNYKKFTIFLSQTLALTVVIQLFLFFNIISDEPNTEGNSILIDVTASFIISLLAILLVKCMIFFFRAKVDYYIKRGPQEEEWFFGRMVGNKKVLLYNATNEFKFIDIDSLDDCVIHMKRKKKKIWMQNFIAKHPIWVGIIITICLTVTFGAYSFFNKGNYIAMLLLFESLVMIYSYTAYSNAKLIEERDGKASV